MAAKKKQPTAKEKITTKAELIASIKTQQNCRTCEIKDWDYTLFVKIHELRLTSGVSYQAIREYLWNEIDIYNANPEHTNKIEKISDSAIASHFKMHVPVFKTEANKIVKALKMVVPEAQSSEDKAKLQSAFEASLAYVADANVNDFQKFQTVVDRLYARFKQFDKSKGLDKNLERPDMAEFRMIGESLARMFEASIKVRNQEKLLSTAVSTCLDTYTTGSLQAILKGFDGVIENLKQHPNLSPPQIEMLEKTLRVLVSDSMKHNAKVALDQVRQVYKLA